MNWNKLKNIPLTLLRTWVDHYSPPYKIGEVYLIVDDNIHDAYNIGIRGYDETSQQYEVEFRVVIEMRIGAGTEAFYPKVVAVEHLSTADLESLITIPFYCSTGLNVRSLVN